MQELILLFLIFVCLCIPPLELSVLPHFIKIFKHPHQCLSFQPLFKILQVIFQGFLDGLAKIMTFLNGPIKIKSLPLATYD